MLAQLGPQLAEAARLPMELGAEDLRHAGLRSWTPEQALSEGVPPHHVPRTVRSHPPPPPPPRAGYRIV